jgi:uncharacterized protein
VSVFLLDANVLLALAWPNHQQHEAAHAWCARQRRFRWATCPSTELAFVRISMQPAIVKQAFSGSEALELLDRNLQRAGHEFWAEDLPVSKALIRVRDRLVGHKQVMDAFLLSLATRRNQKLATFDQGVLALLPPDSPEGRHVAVVPTSVRRTRL